MASLGEKLRGVREAKRELSLNKLAASADIDKRSLSLYERNRQEPPFSRLKRLCEKLQIRAGYLFDEVDELRRLSPHQVAAIESFRLLMRRRGLRLSLVEEKGFSKLARTALSPTTIEGWKDHLGRSRAGRLRR